ncbi:formate dehydrogenase subunit delta [Paraburkholderia phosphatilytica]|uniref:formate dehydrogenase subunit delta n=1 Tax=Paraburkholderia phosphatilytica TaxID=2282883 RepID=UPI000E4AACE4|nr:formate dehydrogenase subunit delta [Paraburkholderia phosphatilytica]
MDEQNLITMANQIGDFFTSLPDHEEAIGDIASHIRRFWEPRMRRAILEALDDGSTVDTSRMSDIVRETLIKHREELMPAAS